MRWRLRGEGVRRSGAVVSQVVSAAGGTCAWPRGFECKADAGGSGQFERPPEDPYEGQFGGRMVLARASLRQPQLL